MTSTEIVTRDQGYHDEGDTGAMVPFDAYSATEMTHRLHDLQSRLGVVQQFFNEVMIKGQDYGIIPGTDKPALLKPGAEKLAELYGYAPKVKNVAKSFGEGGFYEVEITMALESRKTGAVVAEGIGSANTFESRYRYRWVWADRVPPHLDKQTLTSRTVGRNNSVQYRLENDDLYSLWNTVLKMAKKRAMVDAVMSATRSSGIFTQDPEAFDRWVEEGAEDEIPPAPKPANQRPPRSSQRAPRNDVTEDGEVIDGEMVDKPLWTGKTLAKELEAATISMAHLAPVLGSVPTKENTEDLINAWFFANPGKTERDLVRAAVDAQIGASATPSAEEPQASLIP